MSLISRRYVDANNSPPAWDPTYVPPAAAVALRINLKRFISARDTGRDLPSFGGRAYAGDPDDLITAINEVERLLRPHAAGLLR